MNDGLLSRNFAQAQSEGKKAPIEINKENITPAQRDTLIALVENGPLEDGSVPSKTARDELIACGLAQKIVHKGEQGYQAATYPGSALYCRLFNSNTIREAKAYRIAQQELRSIRNQG